MAILNEAPGRPLGAARAGGRVPPETMVTVTVTVVETSCTVTVLGRVPASCL
jgi:hypothetical protein